MDIVRHLVPPVINFRFVLKRGWEDEYSGYTCKSGGKWGFQRQLPCKLRSKRRNLPEKRLAFH